MATEARVPRLGDWLIDQGHLTPTELELALGEQRRAGKLLGQALLDLGFVSQEILARFLAQKTRTESVGVRRVEVPADVLQLVPEGLARRLVALPLLREQDILTVAVADPLDVTTFDLLEQTTGLQVNLVAAADGELREAIERCYPSRQTPGTLVEEVLREERAEETAGSITAGDEAPMIRLVDRLIADAVQDGASDIHVHPEERMVRVRYRRDGVLESGQLLPKSVQPGLIARFKILGGLDIAETRRPQDGRGGVVVGGREVGLRFSCLPTAFGESLVIRLLEKASVGRDLESLGFEGELATQFRGLLERPHGVVLVTGPTGSGKTTSLYAALRSLDGARQSIFTLEDPIEYQLPLVRQTQIQEAIGLTFAEGLRTLLRQDPDVILVGETRDAETAQLMVRAALTGHLVFSTLHTNDAIGAVPRLRDLGVAPFLLSAALCGVLSQRLVRRVCPACREADPNGRAKAEVLGGGGGRWDGAEWSRGRGCGGCHQTGYRGRLALHELLVVDRAIQKAIADDADAGALGDLARKSGYRTLVEDGMVKASRGLTSVEEVMRVTGD